MLENQIAHDQAKGMIGTRPGFGEIGQHKVDGLGRMFGFRSRKHLDGKIERDQRCAQGAQPSRVFTSAAANL